MGINAEKARLSTVDVLAGLQKEKLKTAAKYDADFYELRKKTQQDIRETCLKQVSLLKEDDKINSRVEALKSLRAKHQHKAKELENKILLLSNNPENLALKFERLGKRKGDLSLHEIILLYLIPIAIEF